MNNINNFKKQTKSLELVCKDKNIINNNLSKVNFMKKSLNMKKGFTLIELLVVVAIIGTLTAVVLIGVNNGRRAGRDAAIQTALNQALTQVQVYATQNGGNYQVSDSNGAATGGTLGWQQLLASGVTWSGIDTNTTKTIFDNNQQGLYWDTNAAGTSFSLTAKKSGTGDYLCLRGKNNDDISNISTVAARSYCVAL